MRVAVRWRSLRTRRLKLNQSTNAHTDKFRWFGSPQQCAFTPVALLLCPHNSELSTGDEMEFKSRIFATSRGSTIDAIGDGKYLVCNPAYCFMVHGLRQAHEAVQRQEKPAL